MVNAYKVFKEGDRVYVHSLGWGTITEIGFHIVINFDSINDTRYIGGGLVHLISFTEYTLEGFSQERPEKLPKKGDIVWIKEDEDNEFWQIGHFWMKSDDRYLISSGRPGGWSLSGVVMTTKNPYENKES